MQSINAPNGKAVNALPGNSTALLNTLHRHFSADTDCDSIPDISILNRLQRQFERIGLNLYPLDGQSVLVSSHRLGMSRSLPDLRAAQIYLRQIGGAR